MRKRIFKIIGTMAVVLLAASALYAGGKGPSFKVKSTVPTNGATGVTLEQAVAVTFNQDVDCPTVTTSTFTLNSGTAVEGTVICSGTVATFTASNPLDPNTTYTATIAGSVTDVGNQQLAGPFVWSFKTGSTLAAPTVTAVTPLNKASGVALNTIITAAFDQAMDPATIGASTFTLNGPGATAVGGGIAYNATHNIATFTPSASLTASTLYTAKISTRVTNLGGTGLASNFIWTFTTGAAPDLTPPTVISTNPAPGASSVPLNQIITATFSKAMAPATITTTNFTLAQGVTPVSGTVTYAAVGDMATFTPTANLTASLVYTAKITTGVTDLAGNHLVTNYVWSFTASSAATTPPTVDSTNPVNNAKGVCTNGAINATFSEAMDPATINTGTFTVTDGGLPVTGTVSLDVTGTIATFTPLSKLAHSTSFIATITTGVTDVQHNPMENNYVWSFTTGKNACIAIAPVPLGAAAPFGAFGGGAGITNQGTLTVINGNIGTTGASSTMTGFYDTTMPYIFQTEGCIYTETTLNIGEVKGEIFTSGPLLPTTLTCPAEGTGPATLVGTTAYVATQAAAAAQTAYNAMLPANLPGGAACPGSGNGAGLTLFAGIYTCATSFGIAGGSNLTLDAQGNANAVWVFQMGSSLTVGDPVGPGVASVILINGAQAKNVFWQVGSAADINYGGGGTMVGTIIASAGVTLSSPANATSPTLTVLNGRALGLNASVTMVNTVINVPAP